MNTLKLPPATLHDNLVRLIGFDLASFGSDLAIHDKNALAQNPGVPFIHVTSASGTHLVFLHPANDERWPAPGVEVKYLFGFANREHILKQVVETVTWLSNPGNYAAKSVIYYNGKALERVSFVKAIDLARDYTAKTLREWSATKRGWAA